MTQEAGNASGMNMNIEEMKASQRAYLVPADIAPVLGCDPQTIRDMAAQRPEQLGFPVVRMGSRTKIPRVPFLRFMLGEYSG